MSVKVLLELPTNDATTAFSALADCDKIKVIELGTKFLALGNNQLQYWSNDEWEMKIKSLKAESGAELDKLRNELKCSGQKYEDAIRKHAEDSRLLSIEVTGQTRARCSAELEELRTKAERLETKLAEKTLEHGELYQSISASFQAQMNAKEQHREKRFDKMREHYETLLRHEKTMSRDCLIKTQNSTMKGQAGENFTVHELNRRFPKAEFEDTRKQSGRGDFIMKEENFCMLIETKNYKNNVTKPEITKFYRDIETNHDVQCGVLLSLDSGICAKDDFAFEVRENKPIIFLHNVSNNMKNIDAAIQIFKLVLNTESIDLQNKEVLVKLKNYAQTIKRNWNKIRREVQKFEKTMMECALSQESVVREVFGMINVKY